MSPGGTRKNGSNVTRTVTHPKNVPQHQFLILRVVSWVFLDLVQYPRRNRWSCCSISLRRRGQPLLPKFHIHTTPHVLTLAFLTNSNGTFGMASTTLNHSRACFLKPAPGKKSGTYLRLPSLGQLRNRRKDGGAQRTTGENPRDRSLGSLWRRGQPWPSPKYQRTDRPLVVR